MLPNSLERAMFGVYATQAIHLADKHGVFRHLVADGPNNVAEIAAATDVDEETLGRLLGVLGVFDILRQGEDGRFAVPSESVPYLDESDSRYVGGFVDHVVNSTVDRLPVLDQYLAKGKAAVDSDLPAPFDTIYADDESVGAFLTAMWQLSYTVSGELVKLADLGTATHLIDVGGASGPFSVAALEATSSLRATVFDLPAVGPHLARTRDDRELGKRLSFQSGDFFREELPEGDRIAFGYVLSDWTDETCLALLRKAYRACAPGGQVLVMERLLDDDRRGPLSAVVMNLSMHVETEGRHRTGDEYVELLRQAGFTECEVRRSTQEKHLVLGRKPTERSVVSS